MSSNLNKINFTRATYTGRTVEAQEHAGAHELTCEVSYLKMLNAKVKLSGRGGGQGEKEGNKTSVQAGEKP